MPTHETWFLLYNGVSADGRGSGTYAGQTTDAREAMEHWLALRSNPYSTGKVVAVTDSEWLRIGCERDWDRFIAGPKARGRA